MQLVGNSKDLKNYKVGLWSFKTLEHFGSNSYNNLFNFLENNDGKKCLCEHM